MITRIMKDICNGYIENKNFCFQKKKKKKKKKSQYMYKHERNRLCNVEREGQFVL